MSSFLLTAILHFFANLFGTSPPPRPTRRNEIEISTKTIAPTAQVSNPSATVVARSFDRQYPVQDDASDHGFPSEPLDLATGSTAHTDTLPTSSIPGFPEKAPLSSRRDSHGEGIRNERHGPDEAQQRIEGKVAALLRAFRCRQAVVIGKVPPTLPKGKVFVVSPLVDVPLQCLHVCCEPRPEEWPVALALSGFDWRESTVWLLRMQRTSESALLQQLKAVEMMSAPCSVLVLLASLESVTDVADGAGFRVDDAQNEKPLFLLRRKEHSARCVETHTLNITPQHSLSQEPEREWLLVRFELGVNSLPEEVRHGLGSGCMKVVGDRRELGEWNVDLGVQLVMAEDVLLAEVLVERGNAEYKYVYMDGRGSVQWEVGGNRRIPYSDEALIRLEEHWRRH